MQMLDRRDNNGGGDWQGNQGYNNRNFGGGYNNQQNNQWGNGGGQHGGYQGNNGFGGSAPQQGGYQNGFNNQSKMVLGKIPQATKITTPIKASVKPHSTPIKAVKTITPPLKMETIHSWVTNPPPKR